MIERDLKRPHMINFYFPVSAYHLRSQTIIIIDDEI